MAISKFSSRTCHQLYMHQHSPKLDSQACCSSFSGGMAVRYKEFCCQAWKFCGYVQYGDATKNSFCLESIMFSFSERVDAQEHRRSLLRWASSIVCRLISASAHQLLTCQPKFKCHPYFPHTTRYSYRGCRSQHAISAHIMTELRSVAYASKQVYYFLAVWEFLLYLATDCTVRAQLSSGKIHPFSFGHSVCAVPIMIALAPLSIRLSTQNCHPYHEKRRR